MLSNHLSQSLSERIQELDTEFVLISLDPDKLFHAIENILSSGSYPAFQKAYQKWREKNAITTGTTKSGSN